MKFFCNMHHQSLFVKFFHTAWNLFPCSVICNNLSTFVVSFCRCVQMLKKAQFMCLVVVYSQGRKKRRRNHYILRGLLQKRLNGFVCSSFTFLSAELKVVVSFLAQVETREHRKPYLADCTRTTVKQIPGINSSKPEFENVFRISLFLAFSLENGVKQQMTGKVKKRLRFGSTCVEDLTRADPNLSCLFTPPLSQRCLILRFNLLTERLKQAMIRQG